ncbi:MAG: metallophosphoesterase [Aerococcus sp.]|nr:metallophosphoesterase [Aerococcus sp.]
MSKATHSPSFLSQFARLTTMAMAVGGYYYYQNYTLGTTDYWVESPKYAQGLEGMTIVQLADLNYPNQQVALDKIVEATKAANPDVIVLTGNTIAREGIFDHHELVHMINQLVTVAPTFAVYGTNDINSPLGRRAEQVMSEAGVHFLNDDAVTYDFHGTPITIMGLMEKHGDQFLQRDPLQMITLTAEQKEQPKILLAHHPEAFRAYHADPIKSPDLVLAGHAMGGQIRLPFIGAVYADHQGYQPAYTDGVFGLPSDSARTMIVSRGIGRPESRVRINNRPEVVAVHLTSSVAATSDAMAAAIDEETVAHGGILIEELDQKRKERRMARAMNQAND